jgi:hypothetical protein
MQIAQNHIQILMDSYYAIRKHVNCAKPYSNIVGGLLYNKGA